jgi:hypothetical protein
VHKELLIDFKERIPTPAGEQAALLQRYKKDQEVKVLLCQAWIRSTRAVVVEQLDAALRRGEPIGRLRNILDHMDAERGRILHG